MSCKVSYMAEGLYWVYTNQGIIQVPYTADAWKMRMNFLKQCFRLQHKDIGDGAIFDEVIAQIEEHRKTLNKHP